jgi:hypothetical protein
MTRDTKVSILLAVIIVSEIIILGTMWYLAVERTGFTDTIDPQPNLSEESS